MTHLIVTRSAVLFFGMALGVACFGAGFMAGMAFVTPPPRLIDCSSFRTPREAQTYYEAHIEQWWSLDPKLTGNACSYRPNK